MLQQSEDGQYSGVLLKLGLIVDTRVASVIREARQSDMFLISRGV